MAERACPGCMAAACPVVTLAASLSRLNCDMGRASSSMSSLPIVKNPRSEKWVRVLIGGLLWSAPSRQGRGDAGGRFGGGWQPKRSCSPWSSRYPRTGRAELGPVLPHEAKAMGPRPSHGNGADPLRQGFPRGQQSLECRDKGDRYRAWRHVRKLRRTHSGIPVPPRCLTSACDEGFASAPPDAMQGNDGCL